MDGEYIVRAARCTLAEARALLAVERKALGDSPYVAEEILDVLRRPEHHAYVACLGDDVVGFCSCFETRAGGGNRLELDMLGVLPAHRHHGLATALVTRSMREARQRGVTDFRAVVATDNLESCSVFRRAGLPPSPHAFDMLVYEITDSRPAASLPHRWEWQITRGGSPGAVVRPDVGSCRFACGREMHRLKDEEGLTVATAECLQVQTMAYQGLWLEKLWGASDRATRLMARALVERAKALDLDEIGYLAQRKREAVHAAGESSPLIHEGFECVGSYLVFGARRT